MAYRPSAGRNQKGSSEPQESNLVPIMNLFLTIIPFLLMMIVIGQVALLALDFESSSGNGGDGGDGPGGDDSGKDFEIIVVIKAQPNLGFILKVTLNGKNIDGYPQEFTDFRSLDLGLKNLRNHPTYAENLKSATDIGIYPEPEVLYGVLLQTIDISKSNGFPGVRYQEYFEGVI